MLRIAALLSECGIARRVVMDRAREVGLRLSKRTLVALLNDGRWPLKDEGRAALQGLLLAIVRARPECGAWLRAREYGENNLWDTLPASGRYLFAAGHGQRVAAGLTGARPAIVPGDPHKISIREEEKNMFEPRTLRHFKLFSNPFESEFNKEKDIFLGEEHIFLREMMMETSRNQGFTAVIGEVGSGKSIMRKAVTFRLESEGIKIIYPLIVDKSRITPTSLIDAIIMDVSEETPMRSLEAKSRQAYRLLKNRAAAGMRQVIIVEDGHLLTVPAIKCLKNIHEFEDGFRKTVGIIIMGQPELKYKLDETLHPELREVIRRITVAEIADLGKEVEAYLKHKFDCIGSGRYQEIFTPDCIDAIRRRLPERSHALSVNVLVGKAMNLAADMGEAQVTAELINMA